MTIEQVLMRAMESQGGLTHGRGLSESVLTQSILTMVMLVEVCSEMEEFCNVSYTTSEQHIDARESRISRDAADLKKLSEFFDKYNPFPEVDNIMSIYSGVVGGSSINCHQAYEIGKKSAEAIIGQDFGSVTLQRKRNVLSLKAVRSSIKINGEKVAINPLLLFQRISLQIKEKNDMKNFINFELAPYPLSLFNEHGFKKSAKSELYEDFTKLDHLPNSQNVVHVVDGGFFLHKVIWQKNDTVKDILTKYVRYFMEYYAAGNHVIFDGYPNANETPASIPSSSTKASERSRRQSASVTPNVHNFDAHIKISFTPERFLGNDNNKNKLI